MRRRSALIQFVGAQGLMILAMVQGLLLVPLYLRYLGVEQYGWWLAASSFLAFLGLADFGITSLVSQRSAVLFATGDRAGLGALVGSLSVLLCGILGLLGLLSVPISTALPGWIEVLPEFRSAFRLALLLVFADLGLSLAVGIAGSLLFGAQRPGAHMAGVLAGTLLGIAATVLLLMSGAGLLALPLGSLLRHAIAIPVDAIAVWRVLAGCRSQVRPDAQGLRELVRASLWLGPAKLSETFSSQIDALIVIKLMGPAEVAAMSVTRKAIDLAIQSTNRLSVSLLAGLAHLRGAGQDGTAERAASALVFGSVGLAALLLCPILVLNEDFVALWVGSELFAGSAAVILFGLHAALKVLRGACGNAVMACGETRPYSVAILAEAAVQGGLGILFCSWIGLAGIAAASAVGSACGIAVLVPRFASLYRMRPGQELLGLLPILPAAGASVALGGWLRHALAPLEWGELFGIGAAMAAIFLLVLIMMSERTRQMVAFAIRPRQ